MLKDYNYDKCKLTEEEEKEIQNLLSEMDNIDLSSIPKIAHGIYVAEEKQDYIALLGKAGFYEVFSDNNKWKVKFTISFGESVERYYPTKKDAIDNICKSDLRLRDLDRKYDITFGEHEYSKHDTKVNAEIKQCIDGN